MYNLYGKRGQYALIKHKRAPMCGDDLYTSLYREYYIRECPTSYQPTEIFGSISILQEYFLELLKNKRNEIWLILDCAALIRGVGPTSVYKITRKTKEISIRIGNEVHLQGEFYEQVFMALKVMAKQMGMRFSWTLVHSEK